MRSGFCSAPIRLQGSFAFILVMRPLQLLETQTHLFAVVENAKHVKNTEKIHNAACAH